MKIGEKFQECLKIGVNDIVFKMLLVLLLSKEETQFSKSRKFKNLVLMIFIIPSIVLTSQWLEFYNLNFSEIEAGIVFLFITIKTKLNFILFINSYIF